MNIFKNIIIVTSLIILSSTINAAPETLHGMGIQKQWIDNEGVSGEMPDFVWGDSDVKAANSIGLYVEFSDGTEGSIAYTDISTKWNTHDESGEFGTLISATGFFAEYNSLHYLYNTDSSGTLPIAWNGNPSTPFGNNVELDYIEQNGSQFRIAINNWDFVKVTTYSSSAPLPTQSQFTPIEFSFSHNAAGFEAVGIGCDISLDITGTSALLESPVSVPELMPSTQHVYVSSSTKSEDGTQETIVISYNADDATTTGLGLRIHFDSSVLSASDISTLVSTDLLVNGVVESDDGDLDSDASTDQYIAFTWASLFGAWPGSVPAELVSITFDFVDVATGSTPINLTASSNAAGFAFDGQNHINLDTSATSEDNCGTPGDLSNQQAVYVASSTIVGSQKYVTIGYSSDDSTTTGLGLRVHYESDKLSLNTVIDILQTDLIFMTDQNEDTDNYDENAVTDKYVEMSWANLFGAWPQTNSINLVTLVFDINEYEPPTQPQQIISVNNTPKAVLGRTTVLEVAYNTTDNNNQLSGLGMRVHFDSSLLSVKEITGLLEQDIIVSGEGPFSDDADFDNDPLTDQYMLFGWASLYNNWPDTNLPTILMNITFDVSQNIDTEAISSTNINFSNSSFTAGYEFTSESYELEILNATWDFDGNGQADALTDGLMMIRYLFGLRDDLVTDGAMAENSPFTSEQIVAEIEEAMDIADIDADGELNALTDGLLLLRYLFDLRDDLLTNGVVGLDGTRTSNEDIQSYLGAHMPPI